MTILDKYISEHKLLEGIPEQYHQAYKEDIEQSLGFASYRFRLACRDLLYSIISKLTKNTQTPD